MQDEFIDSKGRIWERCQHAITYRSPTRISTFLFEKHRGQWMGFGIAHSARFRCAEESISDLEAAWAALKG